MVLVITKRQKQLLSRKIVACNTTGWDGLTHPYVDSAREASSVKLCSLEHIRSLASLFKLLLYRRIPGVVLDVV